VTVTVSSKFQIVIPRAIRESLKIRPGTRLHAIEYRGRLELIPIRSAKGARGFLQGLDTTIEREPDRK
jgi:AbrB family looped-hinge helix DNA binding protein